MGLVALLFLPDRPESTKLFNKEERRLALDRMNRDTSADVGRGVNKSNEIYILAALLCRKIFNGVLIRSY